MSSSTHIPHFKWHELFPFVHLLLTSPKKERKPSSSPGGLVKTKTHFGTTLDGSSTASECWFCHHLLVLAVWLSLFCSHPTLPHPHENEKHSLNKYQQNNTNESFFLKITSHITHLFLSERQKTFFSFELVSLPLTMINNFWNFDFLLLPSPSLHPLRRSSLARLEKLCKKKMWKISWGWYFV